MISLHGFKEFSLPFNLLCSISCISDMQWETSTLQTSPYLNRLSFHAWRNAPGSEDWICHDGWCGYIFLLCALTQFPPISTCPWLYCHIPFSTKNIQDLLTWRHHWPRSPQSVKLLLFLLFCFFTVLSTYFCPCSENTTWLYNMPLSWGYHHQCLY